jgi:hypothetical protein
MPKRDEMALLQSGISKILSDSKLPKQPPRSYVQFHKLAVNHKWGELGRDAARDIAAGHRLLADVDDATVQAQKVDRASSDIAEGARHVARLDHHTAWPRFRSRILAELAEREANPKRSAALLAQIGTMSGADVCVSLERLRSGLTNQMKEASERGASTLVRGQLAAAVSELNTPTPGPLGTTAAAQRWLSSAEERHRDWLSQTRTLVKDGRQQDLRRLLSRRAPGLTSQLQAGAAHARDVAQARHEAPNDILDGLAIDLGDSIRNILVAIAGSAYLERLARIGDLGSAEGGWRQAATRSTTDVGSSPIAFAHVALADVSTGQTNVGAAIEVQGRIDGLQIKHSAGHSRSYLRLTDDAGAHVYAHAAYMKLDSGGASIGGAARIQGMWGADLEWVPGHKSISIYRRPLLDHADFSWQSWLLAKLRAVYVPYPNSLSLHASFEPGAQGAVNPLSYGMERARGQIFVPREGSAHGLR